MGKCVVIGFLCGDRIYGFTYTAIGMEDKANHNQDKHNGKQRIKIHNQEQIYLWQNRKANNHVTPFPDTQTKEDQIIQETLNTMDLQRRIQD